MKSCANWNKQVYGDEYVVRLLLAEAGLEVLC